MATRVVRRLVTSVDVDDGQTTVSLSALHEAELDDGSRVLLLDDRGWSTSAAWHMLSLADIRETARMVVGPDEPFGDRTHEDMATGHWTTLRETVRRRGVAVDASELRNLPHDVVLSPRLIARLGGRPTG